MGCGGCAKRFARARVFAEFARARGNGFAGPEIAGAAALERLRAGSGSELADVRRGNWRSESAGGRESSDGRGTFVFGVGGSGGGLRAAGKFGAVAEPGGTGKDLPARGER